MSEPSGHQQILDSSVVLDLAFDLRTRGDAEAKVKSTALVGDIVCHNTPLYKAPAGGPFFARLASPIRASYGSCWFISWELQIDQRRRRL
jgi:hypothetical protein